MGRTGELQLVPASAYTDGNQEHDSYTQTSNLRITNVPQQKTYLKSGTKLNNK